MLQYDSKLMNVLGKLTELMLLNALTFLCSLPIFTMGAALTALHHSLRSCFLMESSTDSIAADYFSAFRSNFRQATLLWLPFLAILLLTGFSLYVDWVAELHSPKFFLVFNYLCFFLLIAASVWMFGLQARFDNPVKATAKNAFLLALFHPFRSIFIIFVQIFPIALSLWDLHLMIYALLFGYSVPALFSMLMYLRVFKQLEDNLNEEEPPVQQTGDAV